MKNILLILLLFISVTGFAQKNYVGIDLFPLGKSLVNGGNYELMYQRHIGDKLITSFKLYNATSTRQISTNILYLDSCSRNSFYKYSSLTGGRLGLGYNIFNQSKLAIYTGGEMNFAHVRGLLYADDYGFCEDFYENHDYFYFGSPARTKGFLIGVVPTVSLQYQFWKNFVLSVTLGVELNYEINQRGYVNLDGELIMSDYTGFLSDFSRNYMIQDIALLYRF
jgi:hypothetical protein